MSLRVNESIVLEYKWKIEPTDILKRSKSGKLSSNLIELDGYTAFQCSITTGSENNSFKQTQFNVLQHRRLPILIDAVICIIQQRMYTMQASLASFQTDLEIPFHREIRYRIITKNRPDLLYRYELIDTGDELWAAAVNRRQTDVEFSVSDVVFGAHQIVIGQRSSFWRLHFDSKKEEGTKRFQVDVNPGLFQQVLHFIYTGRLKMAPNRKLLELAEEYQMEALVNLCRCATQELQVMEETPEMKAEGVTWSGRASYVRQGLLLNSICKGSFRSSQPSQTQVIRMPHRGVFVVGVEKSTCNDNGFLPADLLKTTFISNGHFQFLEAFGPEFIDQMSRRKMMKKTRKISGANAIFFNRFLRLSRGPVLDLSVSFFLGNRMEKWGYRLVDSTRSAQLWRAVMDGVDSDVQIWVGRTKFTVHRCILSARSVVFQRMLKHENRLVLDDTNAAIVEELLYFIYTGQLRIDPNNRRLLEVAEKFQVEILQNICQHAVHHCKFKCDSEEFNSLRFAFPSIAHLFLLDPSEIQPS